MQIIEQFTLSKTGRAEDNEDGIFVSPDFVAVIDGVTGKTDKRENGLTGGHLAAMLICGVLEKLRGHEDCRTVFFRLQRAMTEYVRDHHLDRSEICLQASVVLYSVQHRQIWNLGDCRYRIGDRVELNRKKIDTVLADARAAAIACLMRQGVTREALMKEDLSRQMILPVLKLQSLLANRSGEFGFPCLGPAEDGKDQPEQFYNGITSVDVPENTEVILTSDGYPQLLPTLAESEQKLAELIRLDPLCCRELRSTKGLTGKNISFDDRTYVRFRS